MLERDLSNYEGHWVALFDELVVGVGETPKAALALAKRNRPKDRFTIRYVERAGGTPLELPPLLVKLRPFFLKQSQPIYLVGGAVRDILLGKPVHDLDFVVPQGAIRLSMKTGDAFGWPAYVLDKERDTGRVVIAEQDTTLDFAKFRGSNLEEDLKDRDFTLNALALPATAKYRESVVDLVGGLAALDARQIQLTNPNALTNDPVRAIRAVRQAHSLSLHIDETTKQAIRSAVPLLDQPSSERIRDEWLKVLSIQSPAPAVTRIHTLGFLTQIFPELDQRMIERSGKLDMLRELVQIERFIDGHQATEGSLAVTALSPFRDELKAHLSQTFDGGVNGRILLRLMALFFQPESANSPQGTAESVEARLRKMAFSNQAIAYLKKGLIQQGRFNKLVQQLGEQPILPRQIYRYFLEFENEGVDQLILVSASKALGYFQKHEEATDKIINALLEGRFKRYNQVINPPMLINGRELMQQLKLPSGPEIGRLLRLIKEEQAAGKITTLEDALNFARLASN
ncbi:MAG: DUF5678 domain-containing protein [Chloroflexota bacterium]